MKIEVLRIKKLNSDSNLKAFVDVCFGDKLIVNGCQVFLGAKGLFAGTPSQKAKDDKYYPIVKIKDDADRDDFNRIVLEAYNKGSVAAPAGTEEVPF